MKKLKLLSVVLAMLMALSLVFTACTPDKPAEKTYTYNTYTAVSPSNWNELTYQDNNDTQIMSYIGSAFFEFDFKFDAAGEIIPGDYEVEYAFATALEDVSEEFEHEAGSGMAWKITIRDDGKWDDGTPIKASDFEYTMKEQLNPLFKNYRADSFYKGANKIDKALEYVFQGSEAWFAADAIHSVYSADIDDQLVFDLGIYKDELMGNVEAALRTMMGFPASYDHALVLKYLKANYIPSLDVDTGIAMQGKTLAEIKADDAMKATWDAIIGWWQTEPNEELHFFRVFAKLPELAWEKVGFKTNDEENSITVHLAQPLQLLKKDDEGKFIKNADGSYALDYKAAYNFSSLPLVHRAKYESCKQAPVKGSTLWTSNYNSTLATTASWGPYMLTEFQAGKMYKLEKNPHWFGWNMEKYDGQYQTTHIVCETIADYKTAFMKFLKGEMSGIGIDKSVADQYKNSDRAYFTPDDFVGSLQLQSDYEALKNREEAGVNKTILAQADFRKALSLGLNRDKYVKATTTSSLAGFGLFNSMHYYDVANGKAYRESDVAKKVLCEVYGVDYTQYPDLDAAVDSITGFDLVQARALVDSAVDAAIAAGDYKAGDKVVLTYGTSVDNEVTQRNFSELDNMFKELMKGTKLEGLFELEFNASFGDAWAEDFRGGAYDICAGGWTGAAWDPGYFLLAYLDSNYRYATAWDTTKHQLTFTMKGVATVEVPVVDEEGNPVVDEEGNPVVDYEYKVTNNADDSYSATYDLMTWYDILNGDWQSGVLKEEFRLDLIAAIEKEILLTYYTVPYNYRFGASLISYQVDYITYEYNTFNAYGGIQYMTYNYDDAAWDEWVKNNSVGGEIDYKS